MYLLLLTIIPVVLFLPSKSPAQSNSACTGNVASDVCRAYVNAHLLFFTRSRPNLLSSQKTGDTVPSRLVVRQFREGTHPSVHTASPGLASARILLILSAVSSLFAATADFSVALMHTTLTEEVCVEPPVEATGQVERFGDCEEHSRACDALRQRSKHTWGTYLKM